MSLGWCSIAFIDDTLAVDTHQQQRQSGYPEREQPAKIGNSESFFRVIRPFRRDHEACPKDCCETPLTTILGSLVGRLIPGAMLAGLI